MTNPTTRNEEYLTLELTEDELTLISQAAALKGCSVEAFVLEAALSAAQQVLTAKG